MSRKIPKIRKLRDLESAMRDLRLEELETREQIRKSWKAVKFGFSRDQEKETLFGAKHGNQEEKNFLEHSIRSGAGWVSGKLAGLAADKIRNYLQKKK